MARPTDPNLKNRILEIARELVVQDGYANLSMRKIATRLGMTAPSIYWYFENKDALVHTLIAEGMDTLFEKLSAAVVLESNALEQLQKGCQTYIEFGLANPEYYEIMFQLHPEQMERYPVAQFRRARRNLELFAKILETGITQGNMKSQNPNLEANFIWTTLHGFVSLLLAKRIEVKWQANTLQHMMIRQLVASFKA